MRFHGVAESATLPVLHHVHRLTIFNRAARITLVILAASFPVKAGVPPSAPDPRAAKLIAWIEANSDKAGLPRSHVGDDRLRNWTFTYDAASAALAYLSVGKTRNARRIVDFYLQTDKTSRLGGVIEAVNPSSAALGEDYGVRSGSNIWLGIAAYHLFHFTNEERYLRFARRLADFAISLQVRDSKDPNNGAVRMGPPGAGQTPGDQHLDFDERMPALYDIMSTENNLDAYALFGMIAHEAPTRIKTYSEAQARVYHWLKNVAYNPKAGRFNRGASKAADTKMASDVQSWAVSALGVDRLEEIAPGTTARLLDSVERECVVTVLFHRADGADVTVTGVDFVNEAGAREAGRERMVSPEWTFQLANAYRRAGMTPGGERYLEKRRALIDGLMPAALPANDTLSFPYATLGDAPVGHGWNTPSPETLSVVGAAWGVITLSEKDPLVAPR